MEVFGGSGTVRPVSGKLRRGVPSGSTGKKSRKAGKRAPQASGIKGYFQATRALTVSLVLTLPILVLYNISLIVPSNNQMNTVDVLSRFVTGQWGLYGMLAVNSIAGLASLVLAVILMRSGRVRWWHGPVLLVEGAVWAVILGVAGQYLMGWLKTALPLMSILKPNPQYSLLQILTYSAGAGYWEEMWFRLAAIGAPFAIARAIVNRMSDGPRWLPVVTAIVFLLVSSFGFSLLHYVGGREQPDMITFYFRSFSGLVFGTLFLTRGLSVAISTHFMYDVFAYWFV